MLVDNKLRGSLWRDLFAFYSLATLRAFLRVAPPQSERMEQATSLTYPIVACVEKSACARAREETREEGEQEQEMQETPAESPETIPRIAFRGKLVECVTVFQVEFVGFLYDMPGKK